LRPFWQGWLYRLVLFKKMRARQYTLYFNRNVCGNFQNRETRMQEQPSKGSMEGQSACLRVDFFRLTCCWDAHDAYGTVSCNTALVRRQHHRGIDAALFRFCALSRRFLHCNCNEETKWRTQIMRLLARDSLTWSQLLRFLRTGTARSTALCV